MKKYLAVLATALMIAPAMLATVGQVSAQTAAPVEDLSRPEPSAPPMLGIHWVRGFQPNFRANEAARGAHGGGSKSPDMTYHGGKILVSPTAQSIFWGPSWANASFAADKISGMDTWFSGFSGSHYAATSDEYSGSNGKVSSSLTFALSSDVFDYSNAARGNRTSAILAEVCKVANIDPNGNGYYSVFTDQPRNGAPYCAYHSYGTCNGVAVQFAFFWNLDNDPGCDPQSAVQGESEGLAALANVSAHELSEARTDPASPGAWYDANGQENGDKCAWTFGAPYVTLSNNSNWTLQGEWSNAAYDSGTGYPNSSGQDGCLSGQ